ncbi:M23 family metallopeptidase [Glaciihabitans sp. UYNi722]|uniref:M23 family metallopeptidase n=1 Tax=Glaciihabitans sp. UYNi722 TaxID=3156344 RepID=UPI003397CAD2
MAGRHGSQPIARAWLQRFSPRRSSPKRFSVRRLLASTGAMVVALGLAATMAIPAASASGGFASNGRAATYQTSHTQRLAVGTSVSAPVVTRDGLQIVRVYRQAGNSIASVGGWAIPIDRPINSPWGPRAVICTGGVGCDTGFHRGDDFGAGCNTPFYAVSDGTVTNITRGGLAGDQITVTHAGGISTAYSHMFDSGILVSIGQPVSAGQNIGLVGSSGDSTGCHLYFEYRIGDLPVDPAPAMASHGIMLRVG